MESEKELRDIIAEMAITLESVKNDVQKLCKEIERIERKKLIRNLGYIPPHLL